MDEIEFLKKLHDEVGDVCFSQRECALVQTLIIYLNRVQLLSPNEFRSFKSVSFDIFDYLKASLVGILLVTLI